MVFCRFSLVLVFFKCIHGRVVVPQTEVELSESGSENCQIDINQDLNEPQPLFIVPGSTEWIFPSSKDGIVRLKHQQRLELICTKSFATPFSNITSLFLTCNNGHFNHQGKEYSIKDFKCLRYSFHSTKRHQNSCYNNASLISIGYEVTDRFLPLMTVCFDESVERTHYVHHQLTPGHFQHQSKFPRSNWIAGGFFSNRNVSSIYTKKAQLDSLRSLLGNISIIGEEENFLTRGHLAPRADFTFGSHQRATFNFINAAPQFFNFNGGNWAKVENAVKKLVADRGIKLEVFTGTFGTLEENGEERFLYVDENNNGKIPIPLNFYKVLLDEENGRGVAIVGVNDPRIEEEDIELLCEDKYEDIKWLKKIQRTKIKDGFIYACDVDDFVASVPHLDEEIGHDLNC